MGLALCTGAFSYLTSKLIHLLSLSISQIISDLYSRCLEILTVQTFYHVNRTILDVYTKTECSQNGGMER